MMNYPAKINDWTKAVHRGVAREGAEEEKEEAKGRREGEWEGGGGRVTAENIPALGYQ